jgi:hypothetical protein
VKSVFNVCGSTLRLLPGSDLFATCGSIKLHVISGTAELVFGASVVSVPSGATAKATDLGGGNVLVQSLVGGPVSVTTNGSISTVGAGQTSAVPATIAGVCGLTKQYVQSSTKYKNLTAKQKQAVDALATAACNFLTSITPKLTATQKAALITNYKTAVQALVQPGWLTQPQADTLKTLVSTL